MTFQQALAGAPMGSLLKKMGMKTRKAHHGSPHDFDKFDVHKIGTGEGAQAYGHGLYFTSKEEIAKYYRDALTPNDLSHSLDKTREIMRKRIDDRIDSYKGLDDEIAKLEAEAPPLPEGDIIENFLAGNIKGNPNGERLGALYTKRETADDVLKRLNFMRLEVDGEDPLRLIQNSDSLIDTDDLVKKGHLYTVEIPDESNMLDWDAPLSEQPKAVQEALGVPSLEKLEEMKEEILPRLVELENAGMQMGPEGASLRARLDGISNSINRYHVNTTAGDYYRKLAMEMGGPDKVSASFREAGIPGITYKGATSSERNFVVFDDEHINLIEKGFADPKLLAALALSGGGALGAMDYLKGAGAAVGQLPKFLAGEGLRAGGYFNSLMGVEDPEQVERKVSGIMSHVPDVPTSDRTQAAQQAMMGGMMNALGTVGRSQTPPQYRTSLTPQQVEEAQKQYEKLPLAIRGLIESL